jgi:hypothetical protein
MEEHSSRSNIHASARGTRSKTERQVDFRWLVFKRGDRAVPIVAVVGRDIGAQFVFKNLTNQTIDKLEISVETNRDCEFDIRECSKDNFRKEVQFESKFWDMFRVQESSRCIVYRGGKIGPQQEVPGWLRIKVKKLEGPTYSTPGVPVNFISVTLALRAEYKFNNEETTRSVRLHAEEVTFIKKGNVPERIVRKVREEWLEFIVVSVFAWIIGLFSPSLFRFLRSLIEMAIGFFR